MITTTGTILGLRRISSPTNCVRTLPVEILPIGTLPVRMPWCPQEGQRTNTDTRALGGHSGRLVTKVHTEPWFRTVPTHILWCTWNSHTGWVYETVNLINSRIPYRAYWIIDSTVGFILPQRGGNKRLEPMASGFSNIKVGWTTCTNLIAIWWEIGIFSFTYILGVSSIGKYPLC